MMKKYYVFLLLIYGFNVMLLQAQDEFSVEGISYKPIEPIEGRSFVEVSSYDECAENVTIPKTVKNNATDYTVGKH